MPSVNRVTQKILKHKNKYVIFYSEWCKYSQNAIELLKNKNIPYRGYIIENIVPNDNIQLLLNKLARNKDITNFNSSHRTRPIIFKHGKFLGGYTELNQDLE